MSATHHATTRHSPPLPKKSALKTALKTARSVPSAKSALAPKITVKGIGPDNADKPTKEKAEEVFKFEDDEDEMTTSFLQYCAMCEKQILVPNSSILYCSESCRRSDVSSPTSDAYTYLNLNSPTTKHPRDQMAEFLSSSSLPNPISAYPFPCSIEDARIPAVPHDGKADLDPTEWKPAEPDHSSDDGNSGGSSPIETKPTFVTSLPFRGASPGAPSCLTSAASSPSRKPRTPSRTSSSEAFTYLAQFRRSSDSLSAGNGSATGVGMSVRPRRSGLRGIGTPSLSFTATTKSSDGDGDVSSTSTSTSSANASYSSLRGGPSVTISIPLTNLSGGVGEKESLTYEKRTIKPDASGMLLPVKGVKACGSAEGSLKKLLSRKSSGEAPVPDIDIAVVETAGAV